MKHMKVLPIGLRDLKFISGITFGLLWSLNLKVEANVYDDPLGPRNMFLKFTPNFIDLTTHNMINKLAI